MSNYPTDQVLIPPNIPLYLESVYKLNPIIGVPSDAEVIGIHAIMRVMNKVVDVQGMGSTKLLAQISEHLFNAQMANYQSRYPCSIFPTSTTYTPPALPAHVSIELRPVSGPPSQEDVIKVQSAIRSYQRFLDIPSLFDPQVDAELSQHLFDIQMARYIQNCGQVSSGPQEAVTTEPADSVYPIEPAGEETNTVANNAARRADILDSYQPTHCTSEAHTRDVLERSNQIAEQANQLTERSNELIERSNHIAEQLTRAVERCNQPAELSNDLAEKFTELFGRLNEHFEQSNWLAEASTKPVEKLGDVLGNINRVLVKIQHAIIRGHKGNTANAVDCLVNEKGDTHVVGTRARHIFSSLSRNTSSSPRCYLPVVVNGVFQNFYLSDAGVGSFLRFYGIGDGLHESEDSDALKEGCEGIARETLCHYLSSSLG